MMDIGFVNRMIGLTRGGGEIWDLNMAKQLEQKGHSITFYVGKPLFNGIIEPVESFDVVPVPTPHLKQFAYGAPPGLGGLLHDIDSQFFTRMAASRIDDRSHDVIQICSDPRFGRVINRFSCPVSLVLHGVPYSLWHDFLNPLSSSYDFFPKFDTILTTGNTSTKADIPDAKLTTVNPGVDTERFRPKGPRKEWGLPTILFVGRFVPAKNITGLVSAFSDLVKSGIRAQLVLVGEGPLKSKIKKKAKELDVQNLIQFSGFVPNERLPRYYRGADVFALSSHHESFGMVLLEAMACGLPVVAPRIDYVPNIIQNGKNGFMYEQGNPQGLRDTIKTVLTDKRQQRLTGKAGREFVDREFSWEVQSNKLSKEYQGLLHTAENNSK